MRRPHAAGLRARDRRRDPPLTGPSSSRAGVYPAGMKVEATSTVTARSTAVSAFNQGVGIYLRRLPALWVEGEVTELRRNEAWAFVFFTLKDPDAAPAFGRRCNGGGSTSSSSSLGDGERVHVQGKAEIYEAKGELSFRATTIERFGLGDHLAAIERLKRVLAAEGLFAAERKRPLPRFPRAVGVVTGADAAARGDVVPAIQARFPAAHIVVAETRVQGARAGARDRGRARPRCRPPGRSTSSSSTRGGGSFEDLLAVQRRARRARVRPLPGAGRLGGRARAGHAALRSRRGRARVDPDSCGASRRARPRRAARRARSRSRDAARRVGRRGSEPATASASTATGCVSGRAGAAARTTPRRTRPRGRQAAGTLAARHPRAWLRRRPLRRLGAAGCRRVAPPASASRSSWRTGGLAATVEEVRP